MATYKVSCGLWGTAGTGRTDDDGIIDRPGAKDAVDSHVAALEAAGYTARRLQWILDAPDSETVAVVEAERFE